jgi:hypothetical protein
MGLTRLRSHLIQRQIQARVPAATITEAAVKRLAVFPKLGVVYNRIQKNANTTTMLLLDGLEVGRLRSIEESKGQHLLFYKAWLTGACNLSDARYMVVVRSPYSRALSSFLFAYDLRRGPTVERYGREFPVSPAGFEDYLRWLKDGALPRDQHWDLQRHSLALPVEAFTDIVHVERYEQEMRDFLARTTLGAAGLAAGVDFAEIRRRGSPHATRPQERRDDFLTPAARRLIAEIYREDFTAFGYDPD